MMKLSRSAVLWGLALVVMVSLPAWLYAQGVTANTPNQNLVGEGAISLLAGFYLPRIMQWLKGRRWFGLLKEGEFSLNRWVAITTAFLTALSIHYQFSHGADGWQFVIGGPHQTVLGFVGQVAAQFGVQEQVYVWMRAGSPGVSHITGGSR